MVVVVMATEPTEVATMVDVKSLIYTQENVGQAINNKEQAEVLNALFLGNHIYEARETERMLRLAKILDMF